MRQKKIATESLKKIDTGANTQGAEGEQQEWHLCIV